MRDEFSSPDRALVLVAAFLMKQGISQSEIQFGRDCVVVCHACRGQWLEGRLPIDPGLHSIPVLAEQLAAQLVALLREAEREGPC